MARNVLLRPLVLQLIHIIFHTDNLIPPYLNDPIIFIERIRYVSSVFWRDIITSALPWWWLIIVLKTGFNFALRLLKLSEPISSLFYLHASIYRTLSFRHWLLTTHHNYLVCLSYNDIYLDLLGIALILTYASSCLPIFAWFARLGSLTRYSVRVGYLPTAGYLLYYPVLTSRQCGTCPANTILCCHSSVFTLWDSYFSAYLFTLHTLTVCVYASPFLVPGSNLTAFYFFCASRVNVNAIPKGILLQFSTLGAGLNNCQQ